MADRYWVGGSGTWNTTSTTNWSASSGGSSGASVPTAADNVFFDQAATYTVTMTGALNCLNITVSAGTVTFATGTSPTLSIAGNIALTPGTTTWNSTGTITLTGTTTRTIDSGETTFNCSITQNGAAGTQTLLSNLTLGVGNTFTLTAGTLALSTFALSSGLFASTNSNARTINFGTGKIVLTSATTSTIWNTSTVTNLTISGTPLVECRGGGTAVTKSINTGALSEANSISFSFLETTGTATYSILGNFRNIIVNGSQTIANTSFWIYGDFTHSTSNGTTTFTAGTNAWIFTATSGAKSINNIAGFTYDFPWTFGSAASTATWTLAANLTLGATRNLTITQGTLNLNSFSVAAANALAITTGTPSLQNPGNADIVLGNIAVLHTSGNFTLTSNLTTTNANGYRFSAGNLTLNDYILSTPLMFANTATAKNINYSNTGEIRVTGSNSNVWEMGGATISSNGNIFANFTYTGSVGFRRIIQPTSLSEANALLFPVRFGSFNRGIVINPAATDEIRLNGQFGDFDNTGWTGQIGNWQTPLFHGNVTFSNTTTYHQQAGQTWMSGNTANTTITTSNPTNIAMSLTINTTGRTCTLNGNLNLANATNFGANNVCNLRTGTFDFNGYTVAAGQLDTDVTANRGLNFSNANSKLILSAGNGSIYSSVILAHNLANLTVTGVGRVDLIGTGNRNVFWGTTTVGTIGNLTTLSTGNATMLNTNFSGTGFNINLNSDSGQLIVAGNFWAIDLTGYLGNVRLGWGNQPYFLRLQSDFIGNIAGNYILDPYTSLSSNGIQFYGNSGNTANISANKTLGSNIGFFTSGIINLQSNIALSANIATGGGIANFQTPVQSANRGRINFNNYFITCNSLAGNFSSGNGYVLDGGSPNAGGFIITGANCNISNSVTWPVAVFGIANLDLQGNFTIDLTSNASTGNRMICWGNGGFANANVPAPANGLVDLGTSRTGRSITISNAATDNLVIFHSIDEYRSAKFRDFDFTGINTNIYFGNTSFISNANIAIYGNVVGANFTKIFGDSSNTGNLRMMSDANYNYTKFISNSTSQFGRTANIQIGSSPITNTKIIASLLSNTTIENRLTINDANFSFNDFALYLGTNSVFNMASASSIVNFANIGILETTGANANIILVPTTGSNILGNVRVYANLKAGGNIRVDAGRATGINAYANFEFSNTTTCNANTILVGLQNNANFSFGGSIPFRSGNGFTLEGDFGNIRLNNCFPDITGNLTFGNISNLQWGTAGNISASPPDYWVVRSSGSNIAYITNTNNSQSNININIIGNVTSNSNFYVGNYSSFGSGSNFNLNGTVYQTARFDGTSGNIIFNGGTLQVFGTGTHNFIGGNYQRGNSANGYISLTANGSATANFFGNKVYEVTLDIGGTGPITLAGNRVPSNGSFPTFDGLTFSFANAAGNSNATLNWPANTGGDTVVFRFNSFAPKGRSGRILFLDTVIGSRGTVNIANANTTRITGADWIAMSNLFITPLPATGNAYNLYIGSNSISNGRATGIVLSNFTTNVGPYVIPLTSGTTWTVPSDWNNTNNEIHMWGAGGGGAAGYNGGPTNKAGGGGGGGGGYTKVSNLALTPGQSVTYAIGAGGGGGSAAPSPVFPTSNGSNGGNTLFLSGTYWANGGRQGLNTDVISAWPTLGAGNGAGAGGIGMTANGGNGGGGSYGTRPASFPLTAGGGGGGGAGGPFGAGAAGGQGTRGNTAVPGTQSSAGGGGGGYSGGSAGEFSPSITGVGGRGGNNRLGVGGGNANTIGTFGGGGGGGNYYSPPTPVAYSGGGDSMGTEVYGYGGGSGSGGGSSWGAYGASPGIGEPKTFAGGGGGGGVPTSSTAGSRGAGGPGGNGLIVIVYSNPPPPSGDTGGDMFFVL